MLLAFIILFPIIFPLVFGAVFGGETPVKIDIGIVEKEQINSTLMSVNESKEFVNNFTNVFRDCPIINIKYEEKINSTENFTEQSAKTIFESKDIDAIVYIPENFSECIMFSRKLFVYISPTLSPDNKAVVENAMISIVKTFSEHLQDFKINYSKPYVVNESIPITGGNVTIIDMMEGLARPIVPELKYIESEHRAPTIFDWQIAGIAGMTIMWFTIMPAAEKVAMDKVTGVRKRILISPCSRSSLLFGNTLSQLIVAFCQIGILYGIAVFVFNHKIYGSLIPLVLTIAITAIYFIGIGLIIGRFSKSPETASQISTVLCFPMMFLSGVFFPVPEDSFLYYISKLIPLSYSTEIIRNVSIRDYGFQQVSTSLIIITTFAIIIYIIGAYLTYTEEGK